jgi:hypothetical protein
MKKALFLLLIGSFSLTGCKFINEKILKKGSDTTDVYIYNLEQELRTKDAEMQGALADLQRESQARIDSIIRYYEEELASKGGKYTSAMSGTYYLIVGSFKNPGYAEDYSRKVNGMGYNTEIVQMGHWNLVAAESYTNLREALRGLEIVRSNVAYASWIYVAN